MWSAKNRKHISKFLQAFKKNDFETLQEYWQFLNLTPHNLPEEAKVFSDNELKDLEKEFPRGVTAQKIVELFQKKGIRFSMPSFRQYIQRGFLKTGTRSGKEETLYPLSSIRRVEFIKYLVKKKIDLSEIKIEETQLPDLWEFHNEPYGGEKNYVENIFEEFFEDDERERRFELLKKAEAIISEAEQIYNQAVDGIPEEKISWSQMDDFWELFRTHPDFIAMRESRSEQEVDQEKEND